MLRHSAPIYTVKFVVFNVTWKYPLDIRMTIINHYAHINLLKASVYSTQTLNVPTHACILTNMNQNIAGVNQLFRCIIA